MVLEISLSSLAKRLDHHSVQAIELRPGQVIRGTVLEVYSGNMALVKLGSTQVLARLETPLSPGDRAWLVVQPGEGPVTLQLLSLDDPAQGAAWEQLLKSWGLTDPHAEELARLLDRQGVPVDRSTISAFSAITAKHGKEPELVEAFALAAKRNLPLTEKTVLSLRAFFSDQPLTAAIRRFQAEAESYLNGMTARGGTGGHPLNQAVTRLLDLLSALPLAPDDIPDGGQQLIRPGTPGMGTGQAETTAGGERAAVDGRYDGMTRPVAGTPQGLPPFGVPLDPAQADEGSPLPHLDWRGTIGKTTDTGQDGTAVRITSSEDPAGRAGVVLSTDSESQFPTEGGRPERGPSFSGTVASVPSVSSTPSGATAAQGATIPGRMPAQDGSVVPTAVPDFTETGQKSERLSGPSDGLTAGSQSETSHPLAQWLRKLGVLHERQLTSAITGQPEGTTPAAGSAKELLLTLVQSQPHAIPAALREAAEAVLQHITGQQLMLSPQAGHPLAHLVVQIPLRTADGTDTAFVQIEAQNRDGRRLDADNCRLYFCLMMERLGPTTVDVTIVNRIVNVTIHNGHEWLEPLLAASRDSFAGQLKNVGYQLSGLRWKPPAGESVEPSAVRSRARAMTEYKGVDLRI